MFHWFTRERSGSANQTARCGKHDVKTLYLETQNWGKPRQNHVANNQQSKRALDFGVDRGDFACKDVLTLGKELAFLQKIYE